MRALGTLLLLLSVGSATAHPPHGLVQTPDGSLYYSDLEKIWRIAPDGSREIAVDEVHAHELGLDEAGRVVGEDVRYLGGDRYKNRTWRLVPGQAAEHTPWRHGFWRDDGFVRDASGARYFIVCPGQRCTLLRRDARNTSPETLAGPAAFSTRVQYVAAGRDGVYVVDGEDILRVAPDGRVAKRVTRLGAQLMGLRVLDAQDTLLVAGHVDRAVYRVARDGAVEVLARSAPPWAPTAALLARDGTLHVLEWSSKNEARVRHVERAARPR